MTLASDKPQQPTDNMQHHWLLTTPGGAALISVVMGGLLVALLTNHLAQRQNLNELAEQEALELARERIKVTREIYDLAGEAMATARIALSMAEPEFQPSTSNPTEHNRAIRDQRIKAKRRYNTFIYSWHAKREALGLLILYYYPTPTGSATSIDYPNSVIARWGEVESVTEQYLTCSVSAKDEGDIRRCKVTHDELTTKLEILTSALLLEWNS